MGFIIFRCTIYDKTAKNSTGKMSLQSYKSYILNKGLHFFLKYFGIQESLTK